MAQVRAQVDKLLTNVSNAYIPQGYISEDALPTLSVKQKTGQIGKYGTSHLRIVNAKMGGRGQARRFEPIIRESDFYKVESHGLEGMVTEDDYDNVEEPFEAESDETVGLTTSLWLAKENAFKTAVTDPAIITQNVEITVAGDKFDQYDTSKPTEIFRDAQNAVLDGCGFNPNRAIMSRKLFNVLKYHPALLELLGRKSVKEGRLSEQEMAEALDVEMLHIGEVAFEGAKLGQASSLGQMWGDDLVFYYAPKTAAKYQKSLGYYIVMKKRGPRRVFKFNINNPPNSKGVIVQDDYQFALTDAKCAFLVRNTLT